MSYHLPYTVFKRTLPPRKDKKTGKMKPGRTVYYYRLYEGEKKRSPMRSTGQTSRDAALDWCRRMWEAGEFGNTPSTPSESTTFHEFATGFWDFNTSRYVKDRLLRSDGEHRAISEHTCFDNQRAVDNHMIPEFGDMLLSEITATMINDWSLQLHKTDDNPKGLSGKRINNILSIFRQMLIEAYVRGFIDWDPEEKRTQIKGFKKLTKRTRGRLTVAEANTLFHDDQLETAWQGNRMDRAINILAANIGARQGEILALKGGDIHGRKVVIQHSWDTKYGLGPTKTHDVREVFLLPRVQEAIAEFVPSNPDQFIFSLNHRRPISGNRLTDRLHNALTAIGVDWEARNIGFHSWRHWFNSTCEANGIPAALTRHVTGHKTEAMQHNYTSLVEEDFAPMLNMLEKVLG